MDELWYEKYISKHTIFYMGTVDDFRLGIVVGSENYLYLGKLILGLDFYG